MSQATDFVLQSETPASPQLGWAAALTLYFVASLTIMVGCVIVPGLETIALRLGVPHSASWLVTLPALGVVLGGRVAGHVIDRIGSRRSLCWGLFGYGALGSTGFLLRGPPSVFADRLLLGGMTALVMASGTAIISQFYAGSERMIMIARQGIAIELGGVLFLSLGGWLATRDWRLPFLVYLAAWLFLAMALVFLPQPPQDLPIEARDLAMEPADGTMSQVYLTACASMVCFFIGITTLPVVLTGMHKSELTIGYFLSFISLTAVAAAACMPLVIRRAGSRLTLVMAFAAYSAAHLAFALSRSWEGFLSGGVLMGIGFGLSIPLVNYLTLERSSASRRGRDLAALASAIFFGQFLSSFVGLLPVTLPHDLFVTSFFAGVAALVLAGTSLSSRNHRTLTL